MSLALRNLRLSSLAPVEGGGGLGSVRLLVTIGDSQVNGAANDQASVTWTPDPMVKSWMLSQAYEQYAPLTKTGQVAGAGTWADSANTGPELEFARQARLAEPTKPVFLLKLSDPGSKQTNRWSVATGANPAYALAQYIAAKAALTALGYTVVTTVLISLGINEVGTTDAGAYPAAQRALYADIKNNWGLDVADRIIQIRITRDGATPRQVRSIQQAETKADPRIFLLDTDGFAKGPDITHYLLAGYASIGASAYQIATGASQGLDLEFFEGSVTGNTWGASTNVTTAGVFTAAGSGAGLSQNTDVWFEVGAVYEFEFDITVTLGTLLPQLTGGTAQNLSTGTLSTSGHKKGTVTAVTGNTNARWTVGTTFTGEVPVGNVIIRRLSVP